MGNPAFDRAICHHAREGEEARGTQVRTLLVTGRLPVPSGWSATMFLIGRRRRRTARV